MSLIQAHRNVEEYRFSICRFLSLSALLNTLWNPLRTIRFVDTHKLGAAPSLIRIVDKFAIVFAVASCLPALGLVPWTKKQGEHAVEAIFLRYMDQRSKIADTGRDVLRKLCELIASSKHFRFQRNVKSFRKYSGIGLKFLNQNRKIVGICRTSATASAGVERELRITLTELEKLLRSYGLLVRNRQNKFTLSVSVKNGIKGSKKSRFMPIDYLKLRAIVGPLKAAF